jgi:hypothetical protein
LRPTPGSGWTPSGCAGTEPSMRSVSASQRDRRRSAFEPLAWALFAATISGWSSSCWPIARSGTIRPCNPAAKARADAKVIDLSSRAAQCAARSSRSSRGVASP